MHVVKDKLLELTKSLKPIFHCNANPFALVYTPSASFSAGDTNMLLSKNPCGPNTGPCRPNASQWNIVRVGYARVGFALFILFFCVGYPTRTWFSVEYGLNKRPPKVCLQMHANLNY